ncbi:peptidoglycan glycosyltransferase [Tistlia consotensis]|uniref:Peptidoglycan glycosyltransferase n=1 Tax=Tistlia consotensis USBA 355 TaxID=560819 RepID=A0A1Y6B4B6_9PROT|nr:penicillin-binding protein 2 [Tistlia consotensis]SME91249.1 peptidoglycan glycosyltransferase [Tistlia consotensis USBA 355]SNR27241.1 peptidoglycan glycosyltransferase [Tistlia consotensis]
MGERRNEEQGRYRRFARRAVMLGGGQLLLLGALAGRMYYLQVVEAEKYKLLAEDNRINIRLLPPPRGRIVDRFGTPLAVNRQNYQVLLVSEQVADLDDTLDRLGQIVPLTGDDRERIHREIKRKRNFVPVTVEENLTWEQVSRVEVNSPDLPGVSIDVGETRHYPFGDRLSHIVGYVAAVSEKELTGDPLLELPGFRVGKSGVEKLHDEDLRGTAGTSQIEVNAVGRMIKELSREEGHAGREVVLTLDSGLQEFVFNRLSNEPSASAAVLDVETGEILAMASVPSYDPRPFNLGLSQQQWQELVNDPLSPLSNKAISGLYAPGSTFKVMVALAALEAGVGADHKVFCPGFMDLGNHRFHCWKRGGHGSLDMQGAIQHSCDVWFYDTAKRIGIDRIAAMAKRFGLGDTVGVDLPGERGGTIPTRAWKLANIGTQWQGGETLVNAIGQGFVLTTPLQLGVMVARLAGGKAVVPHVTRGLRGGGAPDQLVSLPAPKLDVPEAHLDIVREAMDMVVNSPRGTAHRSAIDHPGWEMAGKTGTSQVRRITKAEREAGVIKNEDLPWRRRDHGLFICFAPVDKPRYACSVVVDHGGGGSSAAAPIAKDIMTETQRRDPIGSRPLPLVAQVGQNEA